MAIIENTIRLDDEMTPKLIEIRNAVNGITPAFKDIEPAINMIMELFKSMHFEAHKILEMMPEMKEIVDKAIEQFEETTEMIAKMTVSITEKSEAIDKVSESIDRVSKSSGSMNQGFMQMTQSSARLLSQLGLIPRQLSSGISATNSLNRSITWTLPAAAKLSTYLAPLTLIATGTMAIVNTMSLLRRETEAVALPSIDELIGRAERLTGESEKLTGNLKDNIEQMKLLSQFGASEALINQFENENKLLMDRTNILRILSDMERTRIVEAAYEEAYSLLRGPGGVSQLTIAENVLGEMRSEMERLTQEGAVLAAQHTRDLIAEIERQLIDIESNLGDVVRDNIHELIRQADLLRQSVIPANQDMASEINNVLKMFEGLNMAYESAVPLMTEYEREIEQINDAIKEHGAELERALAIERATATVRESTQHSILRSYRDTYAAAESLRDAHYALTHAMAGTYSEAMSQLDVFKKIMNLSPQYLNFLFNEHGALLNVEDAVAAVTQAQIDLMGVRQADLVLDAAQKWID
jgi:ABC-type transporter Mla subunit MlaD